MAERLRRIAGAFQTFEQSDLESLFFGLSADRGEQPLQLSAVSQIADPVIKTEHEFAILCEFLRVWIFVNAVDGGNRVFLKLPGDSFVCRQHELFYQLVRFVVLDAL